MDEPQAGSRAVARVRRFAAVSRWNLWSEPSSFIVYCLVVEATALATTVTAAVAVPFQARDLVTLAFLAVVGVGQAEAGRHVERVRRWVGTGPHINMTSVWTFAGVLVLRQPALIALLVAILYGHLALRSWHRLRKVPPFRTTFNACLVIVTCYCAYAVLAWGGVDGIHAALELEWAGMGGIAGAAVTYFVVGAVVALPGLKPAHRTIRELFGGWLDNLLEISTLCLGALTGLALVTTPALALAVVPPLLLLHRIVLVKQLEVTASRDTRTGLFNLDGWRTLASEVLHKTDRKNGKTVGVLMVDIDRFTRIRNTYGPLVEDTVLKAIADAITSEVRTYDAVGRFDRDQFVILLPDITKSATERAAEGIRSAINHLKIHVPVDQWPRTSDEWPTPITSLSASIGIAMAGEGAATIAKLLYTADAGVSVAKLYGGNKTIALPNAA